MPPFPFTEAGDVTCELEVPQVLPDGTRLFADVYRPAGGGRHPVLLQRMPYDKRTAENLVYQHPIWYARHGYMVVVQDVRGRFKSGGEFIPFEHEEADGAAAVEWAAALPGANGRVGMYGYSYPGATQLLAARAQPPSLRAIVPATTGSQFHDGWTFQGGALSLAFVQSWATELISGQALRRGDDAALRALAAGAASGQPYAQLPLKSVPHLRQPEGQFFADWLDHPTNDGFWQRWSLESDYGRLRLPALHVGGWYDTFLRGTITNYLGMVAAGAPHQRLAIGPWYHMPWTRQVGAVDFGPEAVNPIDRWQLAFFDQHLKDRAPEVPPAPVAVFVMGENRWRELASWPPAAAQPRAYYLHSGGGANTVEGDGWLSTEPPAAEPADVLVYSPLHAVPSAGGTSCCFPAVAPMGPADQGAVEANPGVLVYSTAPLAEGVCLIGPVKVVLWAATTARDTDFTAKLCHVDRRGRSINLASGILRARYRSSRAQATPIEPGETYDYTIDLGATAVRLEPGERLRVQVSSSDFPHWDRNLNTGGPFGEEPASAAVVATQLVRHDADHPSRLEVSVLPD